MCNRIDCHNNMGKWVQFQTQWGTHRGIISGVNNRAVLMRVPRQYAPMGLASHAPNQTSDDTKLDLALAQWGGVGGGYPGGWGGYGKPGYGAYGGGWGAPGYGGWYGGWWWWWLAFAWIFALAFLW